MKSTKPSRPKNGQKERERKIRQLKEKIKMAQSQIRNIMAASK